MKYYIVLIITIIILCIIALVIKKCLKKSNTETDISTMMITTGISLIVAAFPGTKEAVISFVAEMVGKEVTYKTDPVMIICGIVLIIFGFLYKKNIRDRNKIRTTKSYFITEIN